MVGAVIYVRVSTKEQTENLSLPTQLCADKYDHFALRAYLKSLGISLPSATEPIVDTSTGNLMDGVLAAFAQFDNDVRSDRTRRNAGGASARTMDIPWAVRLHECTTRNAPKHLSP